MIIQFPIPIDSIRRTAEGEGARGFEDRGQPASPAGTDREVGNAPSPSALLRQEMNDRPRVNGTGREERDGMSVTTPEVSLWTGEPARKVPYRERVIRGLINGEHQVFPVAVGGPFGLDPEKMGSCVPCGGFFPREGEARAFYVGSRLEYAHPGCIVFDLAGWLPREDPTFQTVKGCSCVDGCSRCGGTGVLS